MLEVTAPYNNSGLTPLVFKIGERRWQLGKGPAPILESPWIDEESTEEILETLIPAYLLRQMGLGDRDPSGGSLSHSSSERSFRPSNAVYGASPPTLPWAWGNALQGRLGATRALLEPILETAEADPYEASWRRKRGFVHLCQDPELDWASCLLTGKALSDAKDVYVRRAWEERNAPRTWNESVTGRMYSRGGIPWHQISPKERPRIIKRRKGIELWECDIISAEPSLALTLLEAARGNQEHGPSRKKDAHVALALELDLISESEIPNVSKQGEQRSEIKKAVMGCLYGAADGTMLSWGLRRQNLRRVHEIRDQLREGIETYFGNRTWGGKEIDSNEISQWIQGSAADIAFEAFYAWANSLPLSPIVPIHDGALWSINFAQTAAINLPESFRSESFNGSLEHESWVRWTKLKG